MRTEKVTEAHRDINKIKELYERAFPENERHPFEVICDDKKEHVEILAFYEEDLFCGFAVLLNCNKIAHIVYFSIEEELRNRGYGSKVLQCVHQAKKESRVIVDIERLTRNCSNAEQRMKRKQFYLRNGYEETEVRYRWHGDDYEILSYGGTVTDKEFEDFWDKLKFII
mgnify:FL=1